MSYLAHHGIKGQQWGVRRYQNEDGTLTEEGKQRYYGLTPDTIRVYNKTADKANVGLAAINKKYNKVDLNDDENNLAYSKEVRDMWQKTYRDVLAKDLGTDSSTLNGQKWLKNLFGYNSNLDDEIKDLEKKVKKQKQLVKENSHLKYASKKMSSEQAIRQGYKDLEKMYPNFNDFSQDKQDKLWIDYMNKSGLYLWA